MKTCFLKSACSQVIVNALINGLLLLASFGAEDVTSPSIKQNPDVSNNPADYEQCTIQLNLIYNALNQYYKRNHEFPRWLSDLVPDYLHEEKNLTCPFVRGTGNVRNWRKYLESFPVYGDPKETSYGYELCTAAVKGHPETSCREYKQEQMMTLGWGVPVVRCLAHVQHLNLALDGTVYKSGQHWEDLFIKYDTEKKILHADFIKGSSGDAVYWLLRPRFSDIPEKCLDLVSSFNATLYHMSLMHYQGGPIEFITNSVQSIGGACYEIRSLVHLTCKDFLIPFPTAVKGIRVDKKSARIRILYGTMGEAPPGSNVATYIFHTENGTSHSVPILYGKDVKTRWFEADDPAEATEPKPAWVSPPNRIGPSGKSLRLYVKTWDNPQPDVKVQSIDFISEMTTSAPFIVAITTE
jgi:hypothetical protein